MNRELLLEELDKIFDTLKKQDWVEKEGIKLRPLTQAEMNTLNVEISNCIYDMVLDFLRNTSIEDEYSTGTLIKVRRKEDNEKLYLLVSEDSNGDQMWLNTDLTLYSPYCHDFYSDHEVLDFSKINLDNQILEDFTDEI